MIAPTLGAAVKTVVTTWKQATSSDDRRYLITRPVELSHGLAQAIETELIQVGANPAAIRQKVLSAPYAHLPGVFDATDLPNTPDWFIPVPDAEGAILGRAAALAALGFLEMEAVSYGSENDGELFVNLTAISGEGKIAEKSQRGLRGHTDAVSFPFNGELDALNPRIAPSPDIVVLVGLRNPKSVPTTIMELENVLSRLSPQDIDELKKSQFSVLSQHTFIEGMRTILGEVHTAIDVPILKDDARGTFVRYSHSSVAPTEPGGPAQLASDNFAAVCTQVPVTVTIEAGDVLLVSNRLCLHGRGMVGKEVGGESRWLLRTYGLNTSGLNDDQRHLDGYPHHVLYP